MCVDNGNDNSSTQDLEDKKVETLRSDIRQLQELPLVLRPWMLLHRAHSGTCSEEPWVGGNNKTTRLLFCILWLYCSDLTDCNKIYGTLFYSSKMFFATNPEETIWLHNRMYFWNEWKFCNEKVNFLKLCPFCSKVTCIQYLPLERLP